MLERLFTELNVNFVAENDGQDRGEHNIMWLQA